MDIIVKEGYLFNYSTPSGDDGGFANINKPEGLRITIDEIGGSYHVSVKLDGVYIQIWCKSYQVRSIN